MPLRARRGHPFNVTVYHVNEGSYGAAPINMNPADLNGVRCYCPRPCCPHPSWRSPQNFGYLLCPAAFPMQVQREQRPRFIARARHIVE